MTSVERTAKMGVLWLVLTAGVTVPAWGQMGTRPGTTMPPGINAADDRNNPDRVPPEIRERMEQARTDDRMKRLKADTDRLLALATSLKADVDKTDKYTLSLDVVRRADEIEKLAKTIRDREKQ